jgi:hypothetical protein
MACQTKVKEVGFSSKKSAFIWLDLEHGALYLKLQVFHGFNLPTGSITPFWVEQKANHLASTRSLPPRNLNSILSDSKDKLMFGFCGTQYSVIM